MGFVDKNSDFSSINKNNVTYQENISFTNFQRTSLSVTGILLGDINDSYTNNSLNFKDNKVISRVHNGK